jgi:pimeloyl-ACP methyl ester carboxylesterase
MHVIERGPQGNGAGRRPLVLLHGVGTGARAWGPQIEAFSAGRRVLAPDLPGFGGTPGPFTINSAVALLQDELQARGVTRCDLCGLSLGALVALSYTLAYPDEVATLTVCAGFARLPPQLKEMQDGMVQALLTMPAEDFPAALASFAATVPEPYRADAAADIAGFTQPALAALMAEAGAYDVVTQLATLRTPTLVLCGANDEINIPMGLNLANLLQADFERIPDAGHIANLDNPAGFNAALEGFLARQAG